MRLAFNKLHLPALLAAAAAGVALRMMDIKVLESDFTTLVKGPFA